MSRIGKIAPPLLLALLAGACATTPARAPVTDVPHGNYVLVEPSSDVYNAVAINDRAYTIRMGNQILSGEHWLDADGRLHVMDDTGACAGQESIWTYSYAANRLTLNLVNDRCTARTRPLPQRMVYERR